jgi:hypothetical protein
MTTRYYTKSPETQAGVVIALVLGVTALFIAYDWASRRRIDALAREAHVAATLVGEVGCYPTHTYTDTHTHTHTDTHTHTRTHAHIPPNTYPLLPVTGIPDDGHRQARADGQHGALPRLVFRGLYLALWACCKAPVHHRIDCYPSVTG